MGGRRVFGIREIEWYHPRRVVGNVSVGNPNGMTERYDVCGVTSFPIIPRGITSKPHNEIDIWLSHCIQCSVCVRACARVYTTLHTSDTFKGKIMREMCKSEISEKYD